MKHHHDCALLFDDGGDDCTCSDDALVEVMAIAAAAAQGWRWYDFKQMIDVQDGAVCSRNRHSWRVSCRAALNALREHGKEMGCESYR